MFGTNQTKVVANIRVGKPDVKPAASRHVPGVLQGNHTDKGDHREVSARRSTGIAAAHHEPIDPRMPKLSPA